MNKWTDVIWKTSSAIYGYPFCRAGQQAFKLLSSNVLRVAAINSVGDFVLFLGKVVVVLLTVLIGIKMLQVQIYFSIVDGLDFLLYYFFFNRTRMESNTFGSL